MHGSGVAVRVETPGPIVPELISALPQSSLTE